MPKKTSDKERKYHYIIAFLVVIIVIMVALFVYARNFSAVANVNGVRITRSAYINELEKQAGSKVLEGLITQSLIYQEAARKHIVVSDGQIADEIAKIEKNLADQKTSLEKTLIAENITRKDLYERIKLNLTTQKLIEKYTKVTDAEVQDFIDKHPEVFSNNTVAEDVRADIKRRLQEQKITDQTQILINTLKKNAHVVIYSK